MQTMIGSMKKYTKFSSTNDYITNFCTLEEALCFKELCDQIITVKSKLTSEAFNPLFKEVKEVTIQELQAFIQKEFNFYSHFLN